MQQFLIFPLILLELITFFLVPQSFAESISIYEISSNNFKKSTVSLDQLNTNLETHDANFPERPVSVFSGAFISDLITRLKIQNVYERIEVLAKNPFLCSWDRSSLQIDRPFLARRENGLVIPNELGGPLKLVFQTLKPISAYCWYVRSIILHSGRPISLFLTKKGRMINELIDRRINKVV